MVSSRDWMKEEIVVSTLHNRDWMIRRVDIVRVTKKCVYVKFMGGLYPIEKEFRLDKELLEMGVHRFITKQEWFRLFSELPKEIQELMKGKQEIKHCGYL